MPGVSRTVSPLFDLALVLARETGHRLGAIISLRWSDVDFERGVIHWRGQNDKIGFDHETPLTPAAVAALQRWRAERPSIGEAWVFPAATDVTRPCSRHLLRQWWRYAERFAGITHEAGLGWHSLRRAFATALKHAPLKDLCELGGWKNAQTILKSYQQADHATMRQVLATRRRTVGAKPA
ncbi:MAG TPA: tyrosine-type recombinase/integrase [Gemmatimonadales bacterium]